MQLAVKKTSLLSLKVACRRFERACPPEDLRNVGKVPEMFMGCVPRGWPFVSGAFHSSAILYKSSSAVSSAPSATYTRPRAPRSPPAACPASAPHLVRPPSESLATVPHPALLR